MNTENGIYISSFIFIQASIFSLIYLVEMDQKHAQVQTDNCAKNCQFRSQNIFSHTHFHGSLATELFEIPVKCRVLGHLHLSLLR